MTEDLRDQDGPPDGRWEVLARYLAGESDPVERARVQAELAADPQGAAMIGALDAALRPDSPVAPSPAEVETALAGVLARRDAAPHPAPPTIVSLQSYRARWRGARLRAAAAVLVVASSALVWRVVSRPGPAGVAPAGGREYAAAVGAVDSLRLPDGSRVILGPASALTLAPDYGLRSRELVLRGDAQFDVAHDAARPFVVRSASAEVRDVGTVFSVQAGESGALRVVVTSGVVAVRGVGGPSPRTDTLRAGDRGAISAGGVVRVERGAASPEDVGWTSGMLVFRDAPVGEVAAGLRRWYGVALVVGDSALAARRLTATFRGGTREEVARVLAAALGGVPRLRGDTLRVDPLSGAPPSR